MLHLIYMGEGCHPLCETIRWRSPDLDRAIVPHSDVSIVDELPKAIKSMLQSWHLQGPRIPCGCKSQFIDPIYLQYMVMGISELFASVTGQEYAYTKRLRT